ncbi:dTDP-4-dehydrorhamnose 3,5-epimerase [Roseomonas terrae]|jgi:dTDP-4-dehydrorhamnose 3,5-epimerase|uniref:dTDP-4-dehydrorhamnose 3,5-epimerase n=1 Tax=Neoroseomonas terrae TaxID=424799 RepID=A0ABS5EJR9_9PROT|nr:dTDP-4-dehydrorhamnose 3,5-epimerase [Neoroseomonas terrae]MBR0651215.1 dTDP-4-dehydrorhamnose 3,5-epimerase [Neoroseomonas terrae]
MNIQTFHIADVLLIEPARHGDARGFFSEVWSSRSLAEHGVDIDFVQDNHAFSAQAGVLRGLHFQRPPSAQGKLVRVARGAILDVAVDIRKGSPTYGRHVSEVLSADNWRQLWVPRGFAHGYVTLEPDTEVLYKTDNYYDREADAGIAWDDPDLDIDWSVDTPMLSEKDRGAPRLATIAPPFPQGAW